MFEPKFFGASIHLEYNLFSAEYHGGAYITLSNDGVPYDVVNVYDYEKGAPTIQFTVDAVRAAVDGLIADRDPRVTFGDDGTSDL